MPKNDFTRKKNLKYLQKLPKNMGDLGKIIVAKGFEKLPKVQLITQSGQVVKYGVSIIPSKLKRIRTFHFSYN